MATKPKKAPSRTTKPASTKPKPTGPCKPWSHGVELKLTKPLWDALYPIYNQLDKEIRLKLGLMMNIPVFINDPLVALENPVLGVQEIPVRFEKNVGDGPTSSRVAVVDFNTDTQSLTDPIVWDESKCWFHTPLSVEDWLPDAPAVPEKTDTAAKTEDTNNQDKQYRQFIEKTVKNIYFHQLNVWAVVHRVLEFYEEPWALGRSVPWGFDGNRLIVVPHAGYGENAFYDRHSKSLQFYYFGDQQSPSYTCLSFDIIAHETGHAVLDGIRPMYNQLSSVQTAAFHEFIGDQTAILLSLFNKDIRHFVTEKTKGRLEEADVLANIGEEFAEKVEGRPYLRTAFNQYSMKDKDIRDSLSPHTVSQVMTGTMWQILTGIATKHLEKNLPDDTKPERKVTPAQALWWAADRFRRVALQPLDLCPPCDIQFIDYAKAVIRNDILTNPVDEQGYRPVMFKVFHERGLCNCGYKEGKDLPENCAFQDVMKVERPDFVYYNIERISGSRTAAYYFLNDNRKQLHIPPHQDIRVVDLYDNRKFNAGAEHLPREIILEYAWQEEVSLDNEPKNKLDFSKWNSKTFNLGCGGTLVFDGNGNLMSWFRKPGTEHITEAQEKQIRAKSKPTKQENAILADLEIGRQRKTAIKEYLARLIRCGLVGAPQPESHFSDMLKPVMAMEEGDAVHFEIAPSLRKRDFDTKEEEWTINY